ncbi:hypothetical protein AZF37_01805 [endosymbiont 'TC1' of Trimyema compressum]|nr:hypothetical protein AZF37_01805 [endosymbiont 'TC1' of Trimyema compressum]
MEKSETDKLMNLESTLHQRVIGQDEAITVLSKAVRRARSGLKILRDHQVLSYSLDLLVSEKLKRLKL